MVESNYGAQSVVLLTVTAWSIADWSAMEFPTRMHMCLLVSIGMKELRCLNCTSRVLFIAGRSQALYGKSYAIKATHDKHNNAES